MNRVTRREFVRLGAVGAAAAPFVLDPAYGTRCSTVLTISHDDELAMLERRFDAQGDPSGETEYALNAAGP